MLDLQPGRDDFLTQAKAYEELLRRPWVGLALDPEWRLQPGEKPLRQIGHVEIDEVNAVGAWLAELVRRHDLPPKVLTLHQFSRAMVRDRERLDTSLDEVQWLVHADGQGRQDAKQGTWSALQRDLPEGVWLGWKNFEDEDTPMLTPEQTMAPGAADPVVRVVPVTVAVCGRRCRRRCVERARSLSRRRRAAPVTAGATRAVASGCRRRRPASCR